MEDEDKESSNELKINVIGFTKVGKTSLINLLLNDEFDENYTPTNDNKIYIKQLFSENTTFNVKIEEFPYLKYFKNFYLTKNADGIILIYSLDCLDSYLYVKKTIEEILPDLRIPKENILLLGNKKDLIIKEGKIEKRDIPLNEIKGLVKEWGILWTETSLLKRENLEKIFELYKKSMTYYLTNEVKYEKSINYIRSQKLDPRVGFFNPVAASGFMCGNAYSLALEKERYEKSMKKTTSKRKKLRKDMDKLNNNGCIIF